eukprot:1041329-Prorocentrum_lima.AAC.1
MRTEHPEDVITHHCLWSGLFCKSHKSGKDIKEVLATIPNNMSPIVCWRARDPGSILAGASPP